MANKLSFGKYEGKTFEWLFFKAPWHAEWLYEKRAFNQQHLFDEDERADFLELCRRASYLGGTCTVCGERGVRRLGLTNRRDGTLSAIGFYCNECEFQGGSSTGYYAPSLFVEEFTPSWADHRRIAAEMRWHYVGDDGNLTQKKMEEFFHNDANFGDPTPGFFNREEVNK